MQTIYVNATEGEFTLELSPRARVDVIDVRRLVSATHGDSLNAYPRVLCCSFHTTAGYLDQSVASRLHQSQAGVMPYIDLFRTMFPEGAGYHHDDLDRRTELTAEQRPVEPTNADSHLAFIGSGLRACVSYVMRRPGPVSFIDLAGVNAGKPRKRTTTLVGYDTEIEVAKTTLYVPVSATHPVDAVNLKDARLGLYDQLDQLIRTYGVEKGRVRLSLGSGEQFASLTVNDFAGAVFDEGATFTGTVNAINGPITIRGGDLSFAGICGAGLELLAARSKSAQIEQWTSTTPPRSGVSSTPSVRPTARSATRSGTRRS